MSLQISLKLKLSRVQRTIIVKYNTFEKATFDQYLSASLALRSKNEKEAFDYVDAISGSGSLNQHFKNLYEKSKKLPVEQLEAIMKNSLFPILKIDNTNKYEFYPELNVSVFNNKLYVGDFGEYPDLIQRLYIQEQVIELNINNIKEKNNPEPYQIKFDNEDIQINIANDWTSISNDTFEELFVNELNSINKYEGQIHKGVDGVGWNTLTNSTINNMFSTPNYYYENGDHYQIRNDNIRKTIVSEVAGFYIYKEEIIPYENNQALCEKVLEILRKTNSINEFKTKSLLVLLTYSNELIAQEVINYILKRKESKELSQFGIFLLEHGIEKNWENDSLKSFMQFAKSSTYGLIYKVNPKLKYDIEVLIQVNVDYLSASDKKTVEKYKEDIKLKQSTISKIIGEITTSGIRENVKKIKADKDTKRFTKLANNLIGHVKDNIKSVNQKELDTWLKDANELKDLAIELQKRIDTETKEGA